MMIYFSDATIHFHTLKNLDQMALRFVNINHQFLSKQSISLCEFFTILKGEMIERSVKMQEVQVETLQNC